MWLKGWAKKRLLHHPKACFSSTIGIFLSVHTISGSDFLQRALGFSSRWFRQGCCRKREFTKQASDTAAWLIVSRGFFLGAERVRIGPPADVRRHLLRVRKSSVWLAGAEFSCEKQHVSGWMVASLWNETRGSWDWLRGPPSSGHSPALELLHRSHGAGKWRKCRRKKLCDVEPKRRLEAKKHFSEV